MFATIQASLAENWPVWFVTFALIVAAVIDGIQLKVPNWLTFPFIISGWIYSAVAFGWEGFWFSFLGTCVGLALLLPLYAIGGMGAGDVKLLAGIGAWMHSTHTLWAFVFTAIVGAIMAVCMVGYKRAWGKHYSQFFMILQEIKAVKDPTKLAEIAAERKSSMFLLPYGIPMAVGTIIYFAWQGLLV